MLGILKKKKQCVGLGLLSLFISPNAEFTDVVILVHLGETQQRLLASGRDVSRWLSDVGFWRPSVHQEAI